MKKIGLFAGAFDPIHDGHLEVAKTVLDDLGLDELVFLVEETPWGDKHPVSIRHRKRMISCVIENDPRMTLLEDVGSHFTVEDTLPLLEAKYPDDELYFIFGADVFLHMNPDQWQGLERLLEHYLVIFERGVLTEKKISEHARNLGIAIAIIPSTLPLHSSTDVRMRVHDKALWVPKAVAKYIEKENLY